MDANDNHYSKKLMKLKALHEAARRKRASTYDALAADAYDHGRYLYENEQVEEAISLFQRLALQHPVWSGAWFCAGMCEFRLGQIERAHISFTVSWMLVPENPQPLYYLALVTYAMGQVDEAKGLLRQVLAIAARHPDHFSLEEKAAAQLKRWSHG